MPPKGRGNKGWSVRSIPFLKIALPVLIIVGWAILAWVIDNPFILPTIESVLDVLLEPFADILGSGSLMAVSPSLPCTLED